MTPQNEDPVFQADCERCGREMFDTTQRRFWALCDACARQERQMAARAEGRECPECRGAGHIALDAFAPGRRSYCCPTCNGEGYAVTDERFQEAIQSAGAGRPTP